MPTWTMHREVYTAGEQLEHRVTMRPYAVTVGGFVEGPGVSEDLVFFYQHMARGGTFSKVDEVSCCFHVRPPLGLHNLLSMQEIMVYRHVASSASFALSKELLMQVCASSLSVPAIRSINFHLQVRADAFQSIILPQRGWEKFSIWGCGRDGKRFFNLLSRENKQRVRAPAGWATSSHPRSSRDAPDPGDNVRRCRRR